MKLKQLPYDPIAHFSYTPGIDLYQQCHDHVRPELWFEPPNKIQTTIEACIREHWEQVDWGDNYYNQNANLQTYMDYKMEDYLCDDPRFKTSAPLHIDLWQSLSDLRTRTVFILHETPSSHIHLLSNFVTAEECRAIEQMTQGNLEGTKTSDGKGGVKPNQVRKAQIARVDIPWENLDDPITRMGRKVFEYVDHIHPNLKITHEGQEPFMAIQYHGRGKDDPHPDQYKSHCDSDCNGQSVRKGQRVATMVMYW